MNTLAPFQFQTATKILFGRGQAQALPAALRALGKGVLLVTGGHPERHSPVLSALREAGIVFATYSVHGEPTIAVARHGVTLARQRQVEVVVSIGGGSVIDAGKAIAALCTNPGEPLDYLEVVGKGKPLKAAPLPFVAVPTTAGTGAEVTKNAVLADPERGVKVSLRSDAMLPRLAVVDPDLTLSVPQEVTAATGLDALTQVIEPFISCQANPLTDAICVAGIEHARDALRLAYHDGNDVEARTRMALTSLFGGLALANAKLGAVHGIAGPFGGMFEAPHGAVCARLLPAILRANWRALSERAPGSPARERIQRLGPLLCQSPEASALDAAKWLAALVEELAIPGLGSYGFASEHVAEVVDKAQRASSMTGNPIRLTATELHRVLEESA